MVNNEILKRKLRNINCETCMWNIDLLKPINARCMVYLSEPFEPCSYWIDKEAVSRTKVYEIYYRETEVNSGVVVTEALINSIFNKILTIIKDRGENPADWSVINEKRKY